jgi:1,4-alpha-glucan branching enzyme
MSNFVSGEFIDPQDPATFERDKLNWNLLGRTPHSWLLAWYRDCIAVRKQNPSLRNCRKSMVRAEADARNRWLVMERRDPSTARSLLIGNFARQAQLIRIPFREVAWSLCLWSGAACYGQATAPPPAQITADEPAEVEIAPHSAALYTT